MNQNATPTAPPPHPLPGSGARGWTRGRAAIVVLVALVVAVAFGWGIARLFRLRFEAGDVYPPYSSLRRDPLGTKAFYESLRELVGDRVRRNYEPSPSAAGERGQTWFVLGLPVETIERMDKTEFEDLETLMTGQGRLVIAFLPVVESGRDRQRGRWERPDQSREDRFEQERVSLGDRWGVEIGFGKLTDAAVRRAGLAGLPERLPWHSTVVFEKLSPAWRVIYARDEQPVIIERKLTGGTVVLVGDSYLFSNEALQQERQTALLSWLIGQPVRVVFDESHFGINENPGVMALVGRYRLQGVVAALVGLAGLFVWKTAAPFVPAPAASGLAGATRPAEGKDSAAALVNLLRRSVPPPELLKTCLSDWKQSCGHSRADLPGKEERLAALTEQRDLVAGYREMQSILEEHA